jgi:hypothetical protein
MLLTRAITYPLHKKRGAAQSIRTSGKLVRLVIDKRAGAPSKDACPRVALALEAHQSDVCDRPRRRVGSW